MSLTERLADTANPDNWDEPPTAEDALRQLVYSAIQNFIEEYDHRLADWLAGEEPEVPGLSEWVDEYAERPLSEADGYARSGEIVHELVQSGR